MHIYESHDHAMKIGRVIAFLVKMTFNPSDPKWPQVDIWPHSIGTVSPADAHAWVSWSSYTKWMSYSIFSENDLLTPVTPNDPGWIFRTIIFVEGIKFMHVRKLRVNATYSEGLDAFWWKWTFDPRDPKWPQMNF